MKIKSIKTKFLLVCLLFLIVPSLVLGTFAYYSSKSQLDAAGERELKNEVRLILSMIDVLNQQVEAGKLPLEEAQEQVRQKMIGPKNAEGKRTTQTNIDHGKYGYFFAIDTKGVQVAHPAIEGQNIYESVSPDGKKIGQLFIQAAQNGGGYINYEWPLPDDNTKNSPKIVYVEMDPNWNWIVAASSYEIDYHAGANAVLGQLFLTVVLSIVAGGFIAYLFVTRITKPIRQIADQARRVSSGDLEIEAIQYQGNDEIGHLASDFTTMIDKLKQLITSVKTSSDSLFKSSEHLARSAEQTSHASNSITSNIMEMAAGTEKQIHSVSSSSEIVNQLATGAERIAVHAQDVAESTQAAMQKADSGNQTVALAKQQMESINTSVSQLGELVNSLRASSNEIGELTQAITAISSQTNLLALNAAIEAAHAGEQGRGFAIVADEVRKLAEQSTTSAEHISRVIAKIQDETAQASHSMEKATREVEVGLRVVTETGHSFEEIQTAVHNVQQKIDRVADHSKRMAAGTLHVVNSIDEVMSVAEEASVSAQNVSAAAEEQLASMEDIATSTDQLSRMSEELREIVRQFETEGAGSWSVQILDRERGILHLVWSGMITSAIIHEVNEALKKSIAELGHAKFDVLVDTSTMLVLPEANQTFADHQKLLLQLGMKRAAVVLDANANVGKAQLDRIKKNSGNEVETQWTSYEEALAFLQGK